MRISGEGLSIHDVYDVAVNREPVELDPVQLQRVGAAHDRVQDWGGAGVPVYGVNTGFGELVRYLVPAAGKTELQLNLIRSHAAGIGETFPEEIARAIVLVRLNCLMKGYSGVSVATARLLRDFLNRGITPLIPQHGSLGASGDLGPLSHMALPLVGLGSVAQGGCIQPAAECFAGSS